MSRRGVIAIIPVAVFVALAAGCERTEPKDSGSTSPLNVRLICGFEQTRDVAEIGKTGAPPEADREFTVEQSKEHATEGACCLKVSFPSEGDTPGLSFEGFGKDWSEYAWLKADVYNPSAALVRLQFKVEDARFAPGKRSDKDCLFWSQNMQPGKNTYAVPLADARTYDEMRFFDLRTVENMKFFLETRPEGTVLYFDNLRLEK